MKLRGGLIGAGNIALRGHAPQWARDEQLRHEADIVAVADLSAANLGAARVLLPGVRTYDAAAELLDRERLDFCDICTPPVTHRPLIEAAARRRLHIVCEKPLALNVAEADGIARAVRAAGIVFRPCHQYHYAPQWQAVRRLLPRLGRVRFAEYSVMRTEANPGNPNWAPDWRTRRELAGGGVLVDHGAHILYQLHGVLGEPLTVLATVARLAHPDYDVEDTALVTLEYGDRLAHISLSWAARHRAIHFRFVGDDGELLGDDHRLHLRAARDEEIRFADGMSRDSSHSEWYGPLLREFSAQVRSGDRPTAPLDEAMYVTWIIERAYESARLGRALPVRPDAGAASGLEAARARHEPPGARVSPVAIGSRAATSEPAAFPGERRSSTVAIFRGAMLLVVFAFAAWALRHFAWKDVWRALRGADPRWLALAAGLNLLVVGIHSLRWLALLRPLARGPRWRDAFEATAVGLAVSTVVPARAGELARMRWIHARTSLSQVAILGSMGLDQMMNAAGLVAAIAFLPFIGGLPEWIRPAALVTLALFAAGAITIFALRPRRSGHERGPGREPAGPFGLLARVRHGLAATRNPRALGSSLGASLGAWALEVVVVRLAARSVGIALPLSAGLVVLVTTNLMLAFPVAPPANLGTLELGATLGLLGFGVGMDRALAFALCYHTLQVVPVALLGGILAGRGGRTTRQARESR